MTGLEWNEKIERLSQLIHEADNAMEEFKRFFKDYKATDGEMVKDYRLGCGITTLDLPKNVNVRFRNVCEWNDIKTIGDLMNFGRYQLGISRNVGRKLMAELDYALEKQYNLKLL